VERWHVSSKEPALYLHITRPRGKIMCGVYRQLRIFVMMPVVVEVTADVSHKISYGNSYSCTKYYIRDE